MLNLMITRNLNRVIRAAIVNNQALNNINPVNLGWQFGQSQPKGLLLIIARNLDNQFYHFARLSSLKRPMVINAHTATVPYQIKPIIVSPKLALVTFVIGARYRIKAPHIKRTLTAA